MTLRKLKYMSDISKKKILCILPKVFILSLFCVTLPFTMVSANATETYVLQPDASKPLSGVIGNRDFCVTFDMALKSDRPFAESNPLTINQARIKYSWTPLTVENSALCELLKNKDIADNGVNPTPNPTPTPETWRAYSSRGYATIPAFEAINTDGVYTKGKEVDRATVGTLCGNIIVKTYANPNIQYRLTHINSINRIIYCRKN